MMLRHTYFCITTVVALLLGMTSAMAASEVPPANNAGDPLSLSPDSPKEMTALATRYEHAEGVPRDISKAVGLYCHAAKSGYADAQYALGWIYANGRGVQKDNDLAAYLFALAAEQGHVQAQQMVRYTPPSSMPSLPACLLPTVTVENTNPYETGEGKEVIFPNGFISQIVSRLAPMYEVDPKLAMAVISVESGFNARAVSPKNAQGLMQLIPETAKRFRVKDAFDPEDNIKGGLSYLQWLLAYFQGNVHLVAAAYNAGERAVEKYRGVPPYPETQDYVKKIAKIYRKSIHPYQSGITKDKASFEIVPAGNATTLPKTARF